MGQIERQREKRREKDVKEDPSICLLLSSSSPDLVCAVIETGIIILSYY